LAETALRETISRSTPLTTQPGRPGASTNQLMVSVPHYKAIPGRVEPACEPLPVTHSHWRRAPGRRSRSDGADLADTPPLTTSGYVPFDR
jgi:hypothetical protein